MNILSSHLSPLLVSTITAIHDINYVNWKSSKKQVVGIYEMRVAKLYRETSF